MARGPRPVATVAKQVIESIETELEATQTEFLQVAIYITAGDQRAALEALKAIAEAHNLALRTLAFVRVDKLTPAQDVVMDAKLRRQKRKGRGNDDISPAR